MAHVVFATSEMAGRVRIGAELASRLEAAGHRATITSPVDVSGALPAGRAFTQLDHGALEPADLREAYRSLAADLTVVDMELPVHVMAAATGGGRIAVWTSMMSVWKERNVPPLHTPIVPGATWLGSPAGIELAWAKFRFGRLLGRTRDAARRRRASKVARLRDVAQRLGYPIEEVASRSDWLVPYTFDRIPTIVFNAAELEFPYDPPPHRRYVGPLLTEPIGPPPPSLQRAIDRRAAGSAKAIVYVAFGAWHRGNDVPFIRRVLDAAAGRREWAVVVGLGGRLDPADVGSLPDNVEVMQWAPQRLVLDHADVALHHGGISSVNECAAAAVPMAVYPFDFLDQPGNAARVEFHGLGAVGDRETDTADDIRSRLDGLLDDDAVRGRLRSMQRAIQSHDARGTALAAVEELLHGVA